jgi:hypothetical protein
MLSITNIAKRREKKSPFRHTGILAVPSVTISDKHQQQLEKHPTTTRQDNNNKTRQPVYNNNNKQSVYNNKNVL